jgi:hypothetical protein
MISKDFIDHFNLLIFIPFKTTNHYGMNLINFELILVVFVFGIMMIILLLFFCCQKLFDLLYSAIDRI